ncbi:COMM domain-containing protein 9 isoform X1 [Mugil cephalus]|uniref:COMM domain-containing protein 9 isoform X1 n=1 Tax=Mugil cephalus TaxID=48193 RepID=UPI001FB79885|nr:COMM domain-containing protein 9 isoform X1 [Mugil cephalus]
MSTSDMLLSHDASRFTSQVTMAAAAVSSEDFTNLQLLLQAPSKDAVRDICVQSHRGPSVRLVESTAAALSIPAAQAAQVTAAPVPCPTCPPCPSSHLSPRPTCPTCPHCSGTQYPSSPCPTSHLSPVPCPPCPTSHLSPVPCPTCPLCPPVPCPPHPIDRSPPRPLERFHCGNYFSSLVAEACGVSSYIFSSSDVLKRDRDRDRDRDEHLLNRKNVPDIQPMEKNKS